MKFAPSICALFSSIYGKSTTCVALSGFIRVSIQLIRVKTAFFNPRIANLWLFLANSTRLSTRIFRVTRIITPPNLPKPETTIPSGGTHVSRSERLSWATDSWRAWEAIGHGWGRVFRSIHSLWPLLLCEIGVFSVPLSPLRLCALASLRLMLALEIFPRSATPQSQLRIGSGIGIGVARLRLRKIRSNPDMPYEKATVHPGYRD